MISFKKIKTFFLKGITGGRELSNYQEIDKNIQRILFDVTTLLGGIFLFPMGVYRIYQGRFFLGAIFIAAVVFFILVYLLSLLNIPLFGLFFTTLVIIMILCGISLNTESYMIGMALSMVFPALLISGLGLKTGIILSLLMGAYIFYARWTYFFITGFQDFQIAGSVIYTFTFIFSVTQTITKNYKDTIITNMTHKLELERNQVMAIKDNLKSGIFFMNADCIIQPHYSKALEDILEFPDLEGRDFVVLLASSLNPKEAAAVRSFFSMVVNRTRDASLLEDANPLSQLQYINPNSLKTKTLRCSFSSITGEDGQPLIFATTEDITQETELKKLLLEEEDKQRTEINTLFEIIQIKPDVLMDFIEDSDFEFSHMNTILKADDKSSYKQILKEIYRSIHAIKANALILGFSSYSNQLHACEEEIKKTVNSEAELKFDDLLHTTFYIENFMKINDNIKNTVAKMSYFSKDIQRKDETNVFLELLDKTVSRAAESKGKLINFSVNNLDERVMTITSNARRMIKEILIQLLRNAVIHGIETPEKRRKAGKNETGKIDLSIAVNNGFIKIELEEDGMGIDFKAVAQHAEKLKLITEEDKKDRLKLLNLLFSDEFSTYKIVDLYAGRGVGLSLVKRLVQELHGTLKIKTEDGAGVKWVISVPIAD